MHACRHARAPKPAHGSLRAAARGSARSMSAPAQGRGQQTHAFTHALETGHHMYMKLADGRHPLRAQSHVCARPGAPPRPASPAQWAPGCETSTAAA